MDNEIIEEIRAGESEVVEFKKSTAELKNALEDICAFANHKGGTLIFGVESDGNIVGQDISNSTIEKVTTQILNLISPKIYPLIVKVEIEGKTCLVIELENNFEKPYFYKGKAYKRVGTSNSFLSTYEIEKHIYERDNERYRWERGKVGKDWSLISEEKVREFLHKVNLKRNLSLDENEDIPIILEKLDLLNNGEIIKAGILAFGEFPQKLVDIAVSKCARFKGLTKSAQIVDLKVFKGTLFEQVNVIENFIKNHIRLQTELTGDSWERKEKWEYPIIALREAVINALIHRDYRDLSETDIAIFDDRIEIWSASKLPKKITVSDLLKPHRSVLRNPTIANLFFLAGEIEKFGTGIKKMIDACNKFRLPIPEFDNSSNAFFVTFRKAKLPEEIMKNLSLTERQKKILEYVLLHRKITNRDYRKLFPSISGETVRLCLNNLVKKGILEKVGTTKGTFYILSPKLFPNYLQISKDIPSKPIE